MKKLFLKTLILIVFFFVFKTVEPQSNWFALESGTMHDLNAVDFIDEETGIAAGMAGALLMTSDGGASWTNVNAGTSNALKAVRYIDTERIIVAGDQGIILYSTDGGVNWVVVQSGQDYDINGLDIDPTSGHGIAGGTGNTVLWTNDFGLTWSFIEGGFMSSYYCACMANADFGMVAGMNSIFQSLIKYTNNGGQNFYGQSFYPTFNNVGYESSSMACHAFDSENGFVVGSLWDGQGFLVSGFDWGNQFWDAMTFEKMLFGVDFTDISTGIVVGGNMGGAAFISETTDGGATWQNANIQGNENLLLDVKLIGATGYAVGQSGEILKKEVVTSDDQKLPASTQFIIHPNPASRWVNILLKGNENTVNVSILSIDGSPVHQSVFKGSKHKLDLEGFQSGLYFIQLEVDDTIAIKKLIID